IATVDPVEAQTPADRKAVQCPTPVQEFYDGANVFITGSTGFLGKILVEKLLRSCPGISTVYLLVRNKKGKNLHTRIDEVFDDVIFDQMKEAQPKFRHKVVGVGGDCSLPDLGLNDQDKNLLIREVNVIFHVAATVRFDEKLKMAVAINVRATQDILRLAGQMPNVKAMIHVSTAFANCIIDTSIEESIYPSPIDYKKLIMLTENLPDKILDNITPMLLDKYPNTYAYTKQIAEEAVRGEGQGLPVGIIRPSIVVSTYKEPVRAWINNMYGATGVAAGAGLGLLRSLHCDPECNANIVPVDMCVNFMIAAAWDIGRTFERAKKEKSEWEMPVFNYESSNDKPISWRQFMARSKFYGMNTPSIRAVWYYSFNLYKHYPVYLLSIFFLHIIPSLIVDGALLAIGKSPRMMKIYSKVHKFSTVLSYFSTRQWSFGNGNVPKVICKMSDADRQLFFSDLKKLDWEEFFEVYLKGVRVYLIQDPIDTLAEAKKKWNRLYWAHQVTKVVVAFLLLKILWSFCSFVYSVIF
ncbi:hypothetical protein NQ318_015078, partial [Aromia moschata]